MSWATKSPDDGPNSGEFASERNQAFAAVCQLMASKIFLIEGTGAIRAASA